MRLIHNFYPVHHTSLYQMSIMISYDCQFSIRFFYQSMGKYFGGFDIEKGFDLIIALGYDF